MLQLFHNPPADLLAKDASDVILQCDEDLSGRAWIAATVAGETIKVRLQILGEVQPEAEHIPAKWMEELRARLQLAPKKHLYRARVRRPVDFLPYLSVLLEPTPREVEKRHTARLKHHIRVMGRQLPDFRATVRDLSEAGIGLDLVGPLPRGTRLELTLEPDGAKDTPFEVEAEVCWCRANVTGKRAPDETGRTHAYEVGARFLQLRSESRQLLCAFLARISDLGEEPVDDVRHL